MKKYKTKYTKVVSYDIWLVELQETLIAFLSIQKFLIFPNKHVVLLEPEK